jgi:GNAT superfamily N-acetyltransferase
MNEEVGALIPAESDPGIPFLMMTYNPAYYLDLFSAADFAKEKDLVAILAPVDDRSLGRLGRIAEGVRRREKGGLAVRPIRMDRFAEDLAIVKEIYNRAWEKNWGFIPMIKEEFDFAAKGFRQVIDPALALVAEKDGRAVGFSLGLPDYNVVFKKMNGRLLPFGFLHFYLGRRSIHRVRVLTLGVIEEYRNRGVETLLIYHTFRNGLPKGYTSCEMSWVLEDNLLARRMFERMGATPYKTYRLFEKNL